MLRKLIWICFFAIAGPTGLTSAADYPIKPVRFIVPYTAGGNTDIVARAISERLSKKLGQQVIVDNRGGAGGTIGTMLAAQATADGYTMVMGTAGTHAVNISLFKKLPYHPLKDFVPVSLVAKAPLVLVIHPSFSPRSVAELLTTIRRPEEPLMYASSGLGTASHLAMELLRARAGGKATHVPYKGNAQALTDLLGGQVPFMFMTSISALPIVKSGKVIALGVTSAKRLTMAPDIPTIGETLNGFEASPWYGVFLPFGTSGRIVERLHAEIVSVLNMPEVKRIIEEQGGEVVGNTPGQFAAFVRAEIDKWREAVRLSGATAQ